MSTPGATPLFSTKNPNDGGIAITILVSSLLAAFLSFLYIYRQSIFKSKVAAASDEGINFLNTGKKDGSNVSRVTANATKNGGKASKEFSPPKEVAEYYQAKETLNKKELEQLNILKKKLMNRAVRVIPIIFSLEREGQSIERLYKKGILTDDIHFNTLAMKNFVDQVNTLKPPSFFLHIYCFENES